MSSIKKETAIPLSLYRAEQVRAMDRYAIDKVGIAGQVLMERAGQAAWNLLLDKWPRAAKIAVFCGPGNNGGDGYVVARLAKAAGRTVCLYSMVTEKTLQGDAKKAAQQWLAEGGEIKVWNHEEEGAFDVIVDGLLGTGLDRPVEGEMAALIDDMNHLKVPILALDIASGLHADSGASLGRTICAAATISFIGLKQGLFTGEGVAHSGEVYYDALSVPSAVLASQSCSSSYFSPSTPYLPKRKKTAHKGAFGHVLVVGGESGFSGAIQMAASAALRSGAGLVTVATRKEHAALLNLTRPELMVQGVEKPSELLSLLQKASIVAIGPGLGQSRWAQRLLSSVIECSVPSVVDADALNIIAKEPLKKDNWVLTPHPGEAARLLGLTIEKVESDRFRAIKTLQEKYGGVIVLKGAGTLVFDGEELTVNSSGNPGMASGGMGDVLTGVIAALLAQGLSLSESARLGAWLHGKAGDSAAERGERGLLASDLMNPLREWVNR
jgi:NAD(P)H-hydrate epimerase